MISLRTFLTCNLQRKQVWPLPAHPGSVPLEISRRTRDTGRLRFVYPSRLTELGCSARSQNSTVRDKKSIGSVNAGPT